MAEPQLFTIPAADQGLDTDSSPDSIAARKSPYLSDFLVDREGVLPMRGPLNDAVEFQAVPAAGPKVVGAWSHNDRVLIGRRAQSATAVRDPWVAPYRKASAESELATADETLKHVDLKTGVVSDVAAVDQDDTIGPSFTRLGDYVYGIGYSREATNSVTVNGGSQWLTQILRWDGTAAALTVYANAPVGAQAVKSHYRRLFVLGGRNPDGSGAIQPNALWFSDPTDDAALTDALTSWQDDTTGLVNQIELLADDNDFGVALARVGSDLCILRRRSIWVLSGYSPSTFTSKPFSHEVGCIDPRSVVEHDDGVYFMSDRGFMFFDGAQLVDVSPQLRTSLLASALAVVGDRGVDGGRCVAAPLLHGYIGVSVGTSSSESTDDSTTQFAGLFHPARNAWVYVSSSALIGGFPVGFGRSSTEAYVYDDSRLLDASKMTLPESASSVDRGFDYVASVFRWVGPPTFGGTGNTLLDSAGTEAFPSDGTRYIIPSTWHIPLLAITGPTRRGQIDRLILDYTWKMATTGTGDDAWRILMYDQDGATLLSLDNADPQDEEPDTLGQAPTVRASRERWVLDLYAEASDIEAIVQVKTDAVPPAEATLQALHLVVQEGHTHR